MLRNLTLVLALFALACGGAEGPEDTTPTEAPAAAEPAPAAEPSSSELACNAVFVRQRECTDEFIPALVDARVRADVPNGIAARAEKDGKDALVAEAKAEWANDSTDEAIAATCAKVAESTPPEKVKELEAQVSECTAKSACGEFVACIIPTIEARFGQ